MAYSAKRIDELVAKLKSSNNGDRGARDAENAARELQRALQRGQIGKDVIPHLADALKGIDGKRVHVYLRRSLPSLLNDATTRANKIREEADAARAKANQQQRPAAQPEVKEPPPAQRYKI